MELEIVDVASRELTSAASEILAAMADTRGDEETRKAKHELMECTVEINTDVCTTVAEARGDLEASIAELESTRTPERAGRAMDRETEDAFERLRAEGYM